MTVGEPRSDEVREPWPKTDVLLSAVVPPDRVVLKDGYTVEFVSPELVEAEPCAYEDEKVPVAVETGLNELPDDEPPGGRG